MNYLPKNLLALVPSLQKKIQSVSASNRLSLHPTRSGWPTMQMEAQGTRRYLHSTVDPRREAERITRELGNYIVVLGFGCAYHIQLLLQNPQVKRIVVIEPHTEFFRFSLEHLDFTTLLSDKRICFLIGETPPTVARHILNEYFPLLYPRASMLPLHNRLVAEPEVCAPFKKAIGEAFSQQRADYQIMQIFGKRWVVNTLRNLSLLSTHRLPSFPHHKSQVGMLIAAGPSTEQRLSEIRSFSGSRWAVDAILPYLLSVRIIPDVVVSIDCQIWGYLHYPRNIPSTIRVLCDLSALFPRHPERTTYFMGTHPMLQFFHDLDLPVIPSYGKNVAASAYILMKTAGFTEIQTVGTDFSYPGGKTHARNTYALRDIHSTRVFSTETQMMHRVFSDAPITSWKKEESICYQTPLFSEYEKEFLLLDQLTLLPEKHKPERKISTLLKEYIQALTDIQHREESTHAAWASLLPLSAWVAAHHHMTDYVQVMEKSALLTLSLIKRFFHR